MPNAFDHRRYSPLFTSPATTGFFSI